MQQLIFESWLEITQAESVYFYFNQDTLKAITQLKSQKKQLKLTLKYRSDLRRLALVTSGLTFCSYYQQDESKVAIFKSVIFLEGKIINQISQHCLENPELTQEIMTAHYWLVEQILANLPIRKNRLNGLAWGLALLLVIVVGLLLIPLNFLKIIAALLMLFLFQWGIKRLLNQFAIFLKPRLWLGIFSPSTKTRKISWYILDKIRF
ncbi:MAG: hypothetical protein DSM107014_12735 [Gomphosphaeria aponina SAG 52.96 = DSM 107014]|uniref:Uncharacterized protein n=1 Tax=Gomphosphaeria aponina SAG 52.96 = DSM 107014 TaxID=1521640 RepID=A0A941JVD2_9CHRO|nr:hypothetical protein [Gomphosphaeria aponina SAG 52.96 = DSM 107014]